MRNATDGSPAIATGCTMSLPGATMLPEISTSMNTFRITEYVSGALCRKRKRSKQDSDAESANNGDDISSESDLNDEGDEKVNTEHVDIGGFESDIADRVPIGAVSSSAGGSQPASPAGSRSKRRKVPQSPLGIPATAVTWHKRTQKRVHNPEQDVSRESLTLSESLAALYGNETLSDVVFVLPCASTTNAAAANEAKASSGLEDTDSDSAAAHDDDKAADAKQSCVRIPGHRMVLAARSSVFSAMLYGHMLESCSDAVASVVVDDIPVDAFKVMLKYVYSDQLTDLNGANVLGVLYAAKKYQLNGLKALCLEYLTSDVSCDNACSLLTSALRLDEKRLSRRLRSYIEDHMDELIASLQSEPVQRAKCNFLELSSEALCYVLKSPYLRAGEEDIVRAALKWADIRIEDQGLENTTDNRRNVMLPVLPLLHFGACSSRFLAVTVRDSGVLTRDQLVDVLFQVSSGQAEPSAREHWRKFKVGQELRVQANFVYPSGRSERKWLDACVLAIRQPEKKEIQVHFTGYSNRFDTWVSSRSEHLAPLPANESSTGPSGDETTGVREEAADRQAWCRVM